MNVGDVVVIDRCEVCEAVVGRKVTIKSVDGDRVRLNFGKGRPQRNRPEFFDANDLTACEPVVVE